MSEGNLAGPMLRIRRGTAPEQIVPLQSAIALIGRSSDCEIVLNEPTVSSRHARLTRTDTGDFLIEDLDSRNNTFLDGKALKGNGPVLLADGQAFRICDFWLIFHDNRIQIEDREPSSSSIRHRVALAASEVTPVSNRPDEALRGILELSRAIGSTLQLDVVLDKVLEALFLIFPQADRGFIHLTDRNQIGSDLIPSWSRSRRPSRNPYTISRMVIREVLERAVAICCEDVPTDQVFAESESLALSGIRTMVCVPILDRDHRPVGILQLDAQDRGQPFGASDLELLLAMLGPIGVAVENARMHDEILRRRQRDRDIQYAREVQRALLPEYPPSPPGYTFWHYYESAYEVGGDYFGYLPPTLGSREATGRCWTIALGDVAGKGMPAALLMAKLSAEVQLALAAESELDRVLDRLNRRIAEADLPDSFITFALLVLDVDRHRLAIACAGHPCPVIRHADGKVEQVQGIPQGPPLGVLLNTNYTPIEVMLNPGDAVVLYSDGATDAINTDDVMFGTQSLLQAIASGPGSADQLGPFLIDRITRFASSHHQADDITLICFGRN